MAGWSVFLPLECGAVWSTVSVTVPFGFRPRFLPVYCALFAGAVSGFVLFLARRLPANPSAALCLLTRVALMDPVCPVDFHASFTAVVLARGFFARTSLDEFRLAFFPGCRCCHDAVLQVSEL